MNEWYVHNLAGDKYVGSYGSVYFHRTFLHDEKDSLLLAHFQPSDFNYADTFNANSAHLTHLGILLTQAGRIPEALTLFQKMYYYRPNDYRIVANLGTIYELSGRNPEAKALIQRALVLNPDSHGGSEWFHVKVLDAKLAMQSDSNWLRTHSVLGWSGFQKTERTKAGVFMKSVERIHQVIHQLRERIPFTPTPNLLIANVLNDLGDAIALEYSVEDAYAAYVVALEYDPQDTYQIQLKMARLAKVLKARGEKLPLLENIFGQDTIKNKLQIQLPTPENFAANPAKTEERNYNILIVSILCILSFGSGWWWRKWRYDYGESD
jgi:tetratricopeptide (TPR) repeat protein